MTFSLIKQHKIIKKFKHEYTSLRVAFSARKQSNNWQYILLVCFLSVSIKYCIQYLYTLTFITLRLVRSVRFLLSINSYLWIAKHDLSLCSLIRSVILCKSLVEIVHTYTNYVVSMYIFAINRGIGSPTSLGNVLSNNKY